MYSRAFRSESRLVVVEKGFFVENLIDNVKDYFFKDFRTNGSERHWSIVIYYLLTFVYWNYNTFFPVI